MVDGAPQVKGSNVKTIIIAGLIIAIAVLLFTNTMSEDTKKNFYYFLIGLVVVGVIVWLLMRKKSMDIYEIKMAIKQREFEYTGNTLDLDSAQVDLIDAETYGLQFNTGGHLVTYKWDRVNDKIIGRLTQKLSHIQAQANKNELLRNMGNMKIERSQKRQDLDRDGLEVVGEEAK